jgi:2-C-methyl-D-erythritol 4-phosphate cytidylyltransferase
MKELSVIIPAAGAGKRMGGNVNKQFMMLGGVPIIIHTLRAFQECERVRQIVVVTTRDAIDRVKKDVQQLHYLKVGDVVCGGEHRQDSVYNGLQALSNFPTDIVMIHDAVRPLVHQSEIRAVADAAEEYGAAVIGVQPKDTIKASSDGVFYSMTLDRASLWAVQTPQAFRWQIFHEASKKAREESFYGTDDAQLVERFGIRVKIVPGSSDNIKVTTPDDLELAEHLILRRKQEDSV